MKQKRFTEEQIIGILKEADAGMVVADLCRKHGMSSATFYAWKSKYGGLELSEARRLRGLEEVSRKRRSRFGENAARERVSRSIRSCLFSRRSRANSSRSVADKASPAAA